MCLFQGSPLRSTFNYTQYCYSYVPPEEPGGGGYAVIVLSLSSMWEEFQHLRNVWTVSNAGLPLVKYLGTDLYFFQNESNDYAVEIVTCYPMKDFKYTHADICPNRMLLKRNTIKIPCLQTRKRRKPYKRIRVKPPSQLESKWYFQKDICDLPLLMIFATAVDLRYPYGNSNWQSDNISLICLNPVLFQNQDFQNYSTTQGYFPKPSLYLYACRSHQTTLTQQSQLEYLGNVKERTLGKEFSLNTKDLTTSQFKDWGNPFHPDYHSGTYQIYTAPNPPAQLKLLATDQNKVDPNQFTLLAEHMYVHVRYNPYKDTGSTNKLYLKANFRNEHWNPPDYDSNILYSGFPFYDMIWGYLDWQEKVHEIQKIQENYVLCMQSDTFNERLYVYIPISQSFVNGYGAYKDESSETKVTNYEQNHWYPQVRYQLEIYNQIGLTGPGCARPRYDNYLQAQMKYKMKVKWGGCPKTLEKPYDPCSQPTWNIPSNFNERIQIQNPNTAPQTEIQDFDWRRDYIKTSTIDRIKKYTGTDELISLSTGSTLNAQPSTQKETTQTSSSETDEEEAQTSLQEQILKLKHKQRKLKHKLLQRLRLQHLE